MRLYIQTSLLALILVLFSSTATATDDQTTGGRRLRRREYRHHDRRNLDYRPKEREDEATEAPTLHALVNGVGNGRRDSDAPDSTSTPQRGQSNSPGEEVDAAPPLVTDTATNDEDSVGTGFVVGVGRGSRKDRGNLAPAMSKLVNLNTRLEFTFFNGQGQQPTSDAIATIVEKTKEFFTDVLSSSAPTDDFGSFELLDLESNYIYADDGKDTFALKFKSQIGLAQDSELSPRQVAKLMGAANYNEYITSYIWNAASLESSDLSNELNRIRKVFFKATGSGSR